MAQQHFIKEGWGFDVGPNFARTKERTPIELAPTERAMPGHVTGYIKGDQTSPLSFMRGERIRVHVLAGAIESQEC